MNPTTAEVAASSDGKAPDLSSIPGPRIKLTQRKVLESVPAGYRMDVFASNDWYSVETTSTRKEQLKLAKNGEFEKNYFSFSGDLPSHVEGLPAVLTKDDKNGSTGAVPKGTNPSNSGTSSMTLNKKEGHDPSQYGVYYISGDTIEFRYADGEVTTHEFLTDGYHAFALDDESYFSSIPEGWVHRIDGDEKSLYRSIDGSYLARVYQLIGPIRNGTELMEAWLNNMKAEGKIISTTPTEYGETGFEGYARTVATYQSGIEKDVYLRYGGWNRQATRIKFTRHEGAEGFEAELELVKYVTVQN